MNRTQLLGIVIIVIGVILFIGMQYSPQAKREEIDIPAVAGEQLIVNVSMGAGELVINQRAARGNAMQMSFLADEALKPKVIERNHEDGRFIDISQESGVARRLFGIRGSNKWTLSFSPDNPVDLRVNIGAGSGDLDLKELDLVALTVKAGAGEVGVRLPELSDDLSVRIQGGVGQATVHIPANANVRLTASKGLGSIDAPSLNRTNDGYVRDIGAEHTLHLQVEVGIGSIRVR